MRIKHETESAPNCQCSQPAWPSSLLSMLSAMFDQKILCDAYIRVHLDMGEVKYIPCHATILAGASQTIRESMMRSEAKDNGRLIIECAGVGLLEWEVVLEFIYKSSIDIAPRDIVHVWRVSEFLQIQALSSILENMMSERGIIMPSKAPALEVNHLIVSVVPHTTKTDKPFSQESIFNANNSAAAIPSDSVTDRCVKDVVNAIFGIPKDGAKAPTSAAEESDCVSAAEDHEPEPTSKRRKMYTPRRVAKNTGHTLETGDDSSKQMECKQTPSTSLDQEGNDSIEQSHRKEQLSDNLPVDDHSRNSVAVNEETDANLQPQCMFPEPLVIAPLGDYTPHTSTRSASTAALSAAESK